MMPLTEGSASADRFSAAGSAAGSTYDVPGELDTALTDRDQHRHGDPAALPTAADETDRSTVPCLNETPRILPEAEEEDGPAAVQIKKARKSTLFQTQNHHPHHRSHHRYDIEQEKSHPDAVSTLAELLQDSGLQASVHDILNDGEEDQMFITGYERCLRKTFLCYVGFLLTFGILRLVMHWRRHWLLLATHRECSLEHAEKVLIHEAYQRKHDLYYVKDVITLSGDVISACSRQTDTGYHTGTKTPRLTGLAYRWCDSKRKTRKNPLNLNMLKNASQPTPLPDERWMTDGMASG